MPKSVTSEIQTTNQHPNLEKTVSLPDRFVFAQYRFALITQEPIHFTETAGNLLRGGLGYTLKRLVCFQPRACLRRCQRNNNCPYGYVFETSPPPDTKVLGKLTDIPRPFVIRTGGDPREITSPGESLTFDLMLFGQGVKHLRYYIAAFQELGRIGLGRHQHRYRLASVEAISPNGSSLGIVYHSDTGVFTAPTPTNWKMEVSSPPDHYSANQLTVEFMTPTRLKHQAQFVRTGPPFDVLVKALLGRVSAISYFHCGQTLEGDFKGLIKQAAAVAIVQQTSHWTDWSRFSTRQQQQVKMGGLVGRVTYHGPWEPYLPLLWLGQWTHVGKGAVVGNGQYKILAPP